MRSLIEVLLLVTLVLVLFVAGVVLRLLLVPVLVVLLLVPVAPLLLVVVSRGGGGDGAWGWVVGVWDAATREQRSTGCTGAQEATISTFLGVAASREDTSTTSGNVVGSADTGRPVRCRQPVDNRDA